MINEGIIPQNFSWRAGQQVQHTNNVGLPTPPVPQMVGGSIIGNTHMQFNTRDTGVQNNEFINTLIAEIDTHTSDILENPKGDLNWQNIRNKVINYIVGVRKKYGGLLNVRFYETLYSICLRQYTTTWAMLCGGYEISSVAETEYIYDRGKGIYHINPFLLYKFFTDEHVSMNENIEQQINS
jgi:hypothetical protein